ncbi:MAG TPA: peptide chain release factor N(5)-glutamine methyltransferase [Jiangellaceae bacterium]|nr:peptide chain release factor N(5)-glutamine methyltransferase [Jiangellaceae bacterium]
MSLRELIAAAADRLAAAGVPSPRHDAEILAAHLLGVNRGELLLQPGPDQPFVERYRELVDRRAGREPLQHITGVAYFRHLTLRVGPGVFVPRPETELVAGVAIDAAREVESAGRAPIVADLYAGSGAIALSVAEEVSSAEVHAVEADAAAVAWLRQNAQGTTVLVHHADVAGCLPEMDGRLDVVAANPPYVPTGAKIRDPEVATHDPATALWSGADGLDAMRVLERTAARLLRPGGLVIAEHADVQGEVAPRVFEETGRWSDIEDHPDLTGRLRFLTAVRPA